MESFTIVDIDANAILSNVELYLSEAVHTLFYMLRSTLCHNSIQVITQQGTLLVNGRTLQESGITAGGTLTVVKLPVLVYSTQQAFAVKCNGSVITWGAVDSGGRSGGVREQLAADVQHTYSTESAFAAVKRNGRVVTWGNEHCGGRSDDVREELGLTL